MPTLHNPAENSLFCHRIGRILAINERVEITNEEAADLAGGPIFVVEGYDQPEAESADEASDDDSDDDSDEADTEASGTPKRSTAKRGAKQVEITGSPDVETRG